MSDQIINKINEVVKTYFENNAELNCIALKNIMPAMISAGVFNKDIRKGLPLRKILRALDKENKLKEIPLAFAHKVEKDIYWYFRRPDTECELIKLSSEPTKKELALKRHEASDEFYILGLCDQILGQNSSRQHRFKFLVGDLHRESDTRTMLPLDAFYEKSSLVIEYDPKIIESADNAKLERKTNSGVSRREQREIYDNRKSEVLTDRGIAVLRISFADFNCDDEGKIIRDEDSDINILKSKIKETKRIQ